MKPVTEDQVQALLSGLEQREKEALRLLANKTSEAKTASGRLTAKVLPLGKRSADKSSPLPNDVVELAEKRNDRRHRVRSKGFFYYAAEPRAIPSP